MKLFKLWKLWIANRERKIIYKHIKIHNGLPGTYYDYTLTASEILDKILVEQKRN